MVQLVAYLVVIFILLFLTGVFKDTVINKQGDKLISDDNDIIGMIGFCVLWPAFLLCALVFCFLIGPIWLGAKLIKIKDEEIA